MCPSICMHSVLEPPWLDETTDIQTPPALLLLKAFRGLQRKCVTASSCGGWPGVATVGIRTLLEVREIQHPSPPEGAHGGIDSIFS